MTKLRTDEHIMVGGDGAPPGVTRAIAHVHEETDNDLNRIRRRMMSFFPNLSGVMLLIYDNEGNVATVAGNNDDLETALKVVENAKQLLETQKVKS